MTSTYMIIFLSLFYRFHLKMESNEETAAAIVAIPIVKRNKKKRKRSESVKLWLRRRI